MKIDFAQLQDAHKEHAQEIEEALLKVARNAQYIMGEEVNLLEQELASFIGGGYAVSCGSGTDALLLALLALDLKKDDEIITTPFTFIATAEMIALLGLKPVFVDIDLQDFNINTQLIESHITHKTKAILAVSLYGQPPNLEALEMIASRQHIKLILDGAQSFGATFDGKKDSLFGDMSTTSFFPAKPLGCYGDGGAIFTQDEICAKKLASLRLHGQKERYIHQYIGIGGRLDAMQAAVLRVKLRYFDEVIKKRQNVAMQYQDHLQDVSSIILPQVANERQSVWAQYTIRVKNRVQVQAKLKEKGIPTAIHYPKGLHLQECFADLRHNIGDFPCTEIASEEVLSLPMNPYLNQDQIAYIAEQLKICVS